MSNLFIGSWRFIEADGYDLDDLDELGEAIITFDADQHGAFNILQYEGSIDYHLGTRGQHDAIEFSWEGTQDGNPTSGRGWMVSPKEQTLAGIISIEGGEDLSVVATQKLES